MRIPNSVVNLQFDLLNLSDFNLFACDNFVEFILLNKLWNISFFSAQRNMYLRWEWRKFVELDNPATFTKANSILLLIENVMKSIPKVFVKSILSNQTEHWTNQSRNMSLTFENWILMRVVKVFWADLKWIIYTIMK